MKNADIAKGIWLPGQPSQKHAHERLNEMFASADIAGWLHQLANRTPRKQATTSRLEAR
ncbi:UNVERIFIED_ORG: Ser/Thr protein kinase RdoA (MazF antagonist) [Pseudomonas reinekei]